MRHVSIRALMGIVVVLAIALAALRNANDAWSGGVLMATALSIGIATIGAFYLDGPRRAARLGFAVFAGGYFALAFLGLSNEKLSRIPPNLLITYIHNRASPSVSVAFRIVGIGSTTVARTTGSNTRITQPPGSSPSNVLVAEPTGNPTPTAWQTILPGAANFEAFSIIGHCLYTLTAGLLGAIIALRYEARREG